MSAVKALVVFTVCLVTGCASGGTAASDSPIEPAIQVQAAALQYVFRNNDSRLGTSADSYCIGVGTGLLQSDPSPQLLRLLRAESPQVARLSNCARGRDPGGSWRVVNDLSRLPSLAFLVEQPVFSESDRAEVYLEYIESPRFSTGYNCILAPTAEGWEVQSCRGGFPRFR